MTIFPLAPDQTIAQMWSNGVLGGQSARMSKIKNDDNPVWQRMLHSCTYIATVASKG